MSDPENDLTPEARKRRGQRNVAIALLLGAFVLVVYLVTIARIGGNSGGAT